MSSPPLPSSLRAAAFLSALTACLGMTCDQGREPPGMPAPVFTDIHLRIADPERALPGVFLAWTFPGEGATYFEVYQSLSRDSLLAGTLAPIAVTESLSAALTLPDGTRPLTVYYAVRAVRVEPTGQKIVSDTLAPDSLTVEPSLGIVNPANGSYQTGILLNLEVQTQATFGVDLRMAYYEKAGSSWTMKLDTCLPMDACGQSVFGGSVQRETVSLQRYGETDTVPALICAFGSESFQGHRTGLTQSVACSRFLRTGP